MQIAERIIKWYHRNKRNLPWRDTADPYKVWISEIILQQTRVDQGLPYYHAFLERFPAIVSLADAPEDEVMKIWEGLGYYSRARNLHKAAKIIRDNYTGLFPKNYKEISALPGIGPYTASAIASFAFKMVYPVVDGNVIRVLSRLIAYEHAVNSSKAKQKLLKLAQELIDKKDPATFNQAIMEFGALQCIPQKPDCPVCPLKLNCKAFKANKTHLIPRKSEKQKMKKRYFHYLYITQIEQGTSFTYIRKRTHNDIWKNLYELPMLEYDAALKEDELENSLEREKIFRNEKWTLLDSKKPVKHILSHQIIVARLSQIQLQAGNELLLDNTKKIYTGDLDKYAFPRLIHKILEKK